MTALFLVLHSEFGGCTWPRNLRQHLHPRWGSPGLPLRPTYVLPPQFYDSNSNARKRRKL